MKNNYFVSVGNICNIECSNKKEAEKTYKEYLSNLKDFYSQAYDLEKAQIENTYSLKENNEEKSYKEKTKESRIN